MTVSNIMTRDVISLDLDNTLEDAKKIFEAHRIHHIMILGDSKELAGIVTDRDLYKHLSPSIGTQKETRLDLAMLRKKIHLIMGREIVTARPNLSLNEAAYLFHKHHISCLPIVDKENRPIGIVSWRDIIKLLAYQFKKKKVQEQTEENESAQQSSKI
jgi:acetoin utilization protein AcuB